MEIDMIRKNNIFRNFQVKILEKQYPYLHIITWGLPKRYLGLLRIFNLQIEHQPHLYLKQYSESFSEYESPSTSSVSSIKKSSINPIPNTSEYIIKDEKIEPEPELAQDTESGNRSTRRKHRRPRKKPIISIKINLDDDLRNLKSRSYSKNLDKLLSKSSQKTHLLIIEKSSSSKRDEYHLSIVNNNTINSHPYSKLIKKNKRKRVTSSLVSHSVDTSNPTKLVNIQSSNFTSENIYPPLIKQQNEFITTTDYCNKPSIEKYYSTSNVNNGTSDKTNNGINYLSGSIADQMISLHSETVFNSKTIPAIVRRKALESIKGSTSKPKVISRNTALSMPSQLIPYKEEISEEKPLRNWPIITQIFNKNNYEICKNYLKSLTADGEEEIEVVEERGKIDKENVNIDNSHAIKYHNTPKLTTLLSKNTPSKYEVSLDIQKDDVSLNIENTPKFDDVIADYKDQIASLRKSEDSIETPNYVVDEIDRLNSFTSSEKNSSSNQFTSTAFLQLASAREECQKDTTPNTFYNEAWQITHPRCSLTDSLVNMRLLSSSTKTYESIVIPSSADNDEVNDCLKGEEPLEINTEKKKVVKSCKQEPKIIRKFYIIVIAIAVMISFVLGILLFIAISDNNGMSSIMKKYFD